MRKSVLRLISYGLTVVFILGGCSTVAADPPKSYQESSVIGSIWRSFNQAVSGEHPTLEGQKIIEQAVSKMDKERLTKLILRYEILLEQMNGYFANQLFSEENYEALYTFYPDVFDKTRIPEIENLKLRSLLQELTDSGYTLDKTDQGLYEIEIDYRYFEKYKNVLTEDAKGYFDLMALESELPLLGTGNQAVKPTDIAIRLMAFNDHIIAYPKFTRMDDLSVKANRYLLALVYGETGFMPYDSELELNEGYWEAYEMLAGPSVNVGSIEDFFRGLVHSLTKSELIWNDDVFDYVMRYPEIYKKRYLNSSLYPDALVDASYGETTRGKFYFYPEFYGITNPAELGKLNAMARSVVEKRMLGEGIEGMDTGGKDIWSRYRVTFNRRDWISIKYVIHVKRSDGTRYWTTESLNYDFVAKRKIELGDVTESSEEREIINENVKEFFEKSNTLYSVSLETFYKDPSPDFYLTDNGINLLIPINEKNKTNGQIVEIFIPFEKFKTCVEYIYKMPSDSRWKNID